MKVSEAIELRCRKAIEERAFPGCVIGIVRKGGERTMLPFGHLTYESNEIVQENTLYDLASITKSIPVASLVLMMIKDGRLNLLDKVVKYLPELQNDHGATIEDLLRYRVQGPRMSHLPFKTFEEIRTYIFEHGFDGPSGDHAYTNLPAYLLGIIIERVGVETLPALAHKYFFEPLKMDDTTFFPINPNTRVSSYRTKHVYGSSDSMANIAPTEIVEGEEIRGIVHDESARVFARRRRAVGHAGLFSTAPDLLNFLEALLRGEFEYITYGAQLGLGWEANRPWMGNPPAAGRSEKTFGKTGFTGTSFLCDIDRGIGLVILSNRTYPKRPENNEAINLFRSDIADIAFQQG